MKTLFLFIVFYTISNYCYCQFLEGEWTGTFEQNFYKFTNLPSTHPIKLKFIVTNDTTYSIFSYTNGQDSSGNIVELVCKVYYKKISNDSIYLEEIEKISPNNATPSCFQKMYFKIIKKNKVTFLNGVWRNDEIGECNMYGKMTLKRKNKQG